MLAMLLCGLFTFLFGGMLLILVLGARRIEDEFKEREREAWKLREQAARIPRFLVVTHPTGPQVGPPDEAFVGHVQQYVEAEQVLADEFVLQPSIEALYRGSGKRLGGH